MNGVGKILILLGLGLVGVVGIWLLAGRIPFIGRLPGDLVVRRENFTLYIPIATSLLISLILTLILLFLRK